MSHLRCFFLHFCCIRCIRLASVLHLCCICWEGQGGLEGLEGRIQRGSNGELACVEHLGKSSMVLMLARLCITDACPLRALLP